MGIIRRGHRDIGENQIIATLRDRPRNANEMFGVLSKFYALFKVRIFFAYCDPSVERH